MKKVSQIFQILFVVSAVLLAFTGCGSDGDTADPTGTLSLSMVDAPGGSYQAVYVSIEEVQVCIRNPECDGTEESEECECDWETIGTLEETYNLLELVGGVMSSLGQKDLEPGDYNQMRLLLHDVPGDSLNVLGDAHPFPQYLVDEAGETHEMKVPSGYESGIKLVHPFEIVEDLTTELILDFDVAKSVVKAGNSGKYRLKPTIKVIGTHNRAVVSGVVGTDGGTPLEGAMIEAWYQDENSDWNMAMGTLTDADGAYMLYLDLGGDNELDPMDYRIVASADGYEPTCTDLTVEVDMTYPATDFALATAEMVTVAGIIEGTVDPVSYPEDAPVATVNFDLQGSDCPFTPSVQTTVVGDNTEDVYYNSGDGTFQFTYTINLPAGTYDVTASCDELDPLAETDFAAADGPLTLNFDFDL